MQPSAEAIRERLPGLPYVPFTVHLADLSMVPMPHPDFATLTPGGGLLVVTSEADRVQVLHTRFIRRIDAVDAAHAI